MITLAFGISLYLWLKVTPKPEKLELGSMVTLTVILDFLIAITACICFS
jgi:hypothetical protein